MFILRPREISFPYRNYSRVATRCKCSAISGEVRLGGNSIYGRCRRLSSAIFLLLFECVISLAVDDITWFFERTIFNTLSELAMQEAL